MSLFLSSGSDGDNKGDFFRSREYRRETLLPEIILSWNELYKDRRVEDFPSDTQLHLFVEVSREARRIEEERRALGYATENDTQEQCQNPNERG